MTDQLTPGHERHDERSGAELPPPTLTRSDRMKSEIMAGGAVVERGEDELAGGWKGWVSMAAILALFVWLGLRQHLDLRVRRRRRHLDLPARGSATTSPPSGPG
jgi:hypothetical protein